MRIFRRKPKFKVGDRVMVTSLYGGLAWMELGARGYLRSLFVGAVGEIRAVIQVSGGGTRYLVKPADRTICAWGFNEWELRPA